MSFNSVRKEFRRVAQAIKANDNTGSWRVVACLVNWEETDLIDANTGEHIPSAYGNH